MDKKDELRHFKISEDEIEAFTGQAEGEKLLLIKMVCKKLKKGKTAEEISEELEEELSRETKERVALVAYRI